MAGGPSILLLVLVLLVLASSQVDVDVGAADAVLEHGKGEEGGKDAAATTGGAEAFKFPPMFVLNLDRAPDRWKYMLTVLDEQGLTAERLPAVDGKNLTDAEMRTQSTQLAAFLQPRGVIGCYLSHKRFWQLVVDRNLPEAIIFEDDVRLVDDFKGRLGDFLRRLQAEGSKPYDVLLLGAIGRVHPEGKDNIGSRFFSSYIGGKRRLETVSEFVYKPRRPAGTHAYMVSNSGARRLLGLCPKATFHVDLDAWRHQGLDIQMFYPMLAYQTFESTSLTDVSTTRSPVSQLLQSSRAFKRFLEWAKDPYTNQPWSHVFAEPLMQVGPGGFVITVERHFVFVTSGVTMATTLWARGYKRASRAVAAGTLMGMAVVRGLIWLLMNWR